MRGRGLCATTAAGRIHAMTETPGATGHRAFTDRAWLLLMIPALCWSGNAIVGKAVAGQVPVRVFLEYHGVKHPIDEVPRDAILGLTPQDESVLFVLEEIAGGAGEGRGFGGEPVGEELLDGDRLAEARGEEHGLLGGRGGKRRPVGEKLGAAEL